MKRKEGNKKQWMEKIIEGNRWRGKKKSLSRKV